MKKILAITILSTLILSACASKSEQKTQEIQTKETKQPLTEEQTFENDLYSFSFPANFSTEEETQNNLLTILGEKSKIEIFKMEDFGDRPFGFSGEETQEEIDNYIPKEELKKDGFDIWLYYPENNLEAKEKLTKIFESITIK